MIQTIGICRFAYPGLGGFRVEHDTVAAREAYLYDPARMEARLRTLKHVCLRTIAAQTYKDFKFLVVTGDSLPLSYLTRLRAMVDAVPQAELVQHPPMNQREAIEEIVTARIDPKAEVVMQFRQDDDDGVSHKFIARALDTFSKTKGLWDVHGRMAIDFNRGYLLRLMPAGPLIQPAVRHHWGVAQALFLRPDIRRTALHYPHHKLPTLMPTVSMTDAPMWLRGVDGTNDSRVDGQSNDLAAPDVDGLRDLEKRFMLDLQAISGSF